MIYVVYYKYTKLYYINYKLGPYCSQSCFNDLHIEVNDNAVHKWKCANNCNIMHTLCIHYWTHFHFDLVFPSTLKYTIHFHLHTWVLFGSSKKILCVYNIGLISKTPSLIIIYFLFLPRYGIVIRITSTNKTVVWR